MAEYDYDLTIIGGGSAGLTAAKVGRFFTQKRIALLDKERLGGDCLHYGCVPSKALIKSARVAHDLATAARFGLRPSPPETALAAVNGTVQEAIAQAGSLDSVEVLRESGVDVFLGTDGNGGCFEDPHTLRSGNRLLSTRSVLIATGSRPAIPNVAGLVAAGYLTNEDLFDLQNLPRRLAVIGGGPIGCELAQALRRLGAEVTVLQQGPRLLPRDDAEVVAILGLAFEQEGVDVRFDTRLESVRVDGGDKVLTLAGARGGELCVDEILVATGRSPNVQGLQLDAAGVRYSARGIDVNDRLQTSQEHIYAAGDVVGGMQFSHYAGYQAAQAVRNIFLPIRLKFRPRLVPWVTFTDPEIALVGLTEAEAKKAGRACTIVRFPYTAVERAVTDRDTAGMMKFLIDGKRRFIGCHVAGTNAGELVNELTLAMNNKLSVDDVIGSIHAYPTYSFGIPIALYEYVLDEHPQAVAKFGRFLSRLT